MEDASLTTSAERDSDPQDVDTPLLEMPESMRRVDWRWAVAKGYLNKEKNEWNQAMGGKEAYLKQRNDKMIAR